jgi:hypothetical protein
MISTFLFSTQFCHLLVPVIGGDCDDVDLIERHYRKLVAQFVRLAQRTTSSGLANTYLVLASHYDNLAKIHAKYQKSPDASSPVPVCERTANHDAT